MREAHQDQGRQGAQELGDKLEGIKGEYPDNRARKTEQKMKEKTREEAEEALEALRGSRSTPDPNLQGETRSGEGGTSTKGGTSAREGEKQANNTPS